jgi:hypothetical protein
MCINGPKVLGVVLTMSCIYIFISILGISQSLFYFPVVLVIVVSGFRSHIIYFFLSFFKRCININFIYKILT